jgi:hypothetical protein
MLIEFIGAAGVGKSYVTERLLNELRRHGLCANEFDGIPIDRTRLCTAIMVVRALYLAARMKPVGLKPLLNATGVIARYTIRRKLCQRAGGVHITSEGVFHRAISLRRASRCAGTQEIVDMLFHHVPPPDMVVLLDDTPERVYARRSMRARSNDEFTRDSVKADVTSVRQCVSTIANSQLTVAPRLLFFQFSVNENGSDTIVAALVNEVRRASSTFLLAPKEP